MSSSELPAFNELEAEQAELVERALELRSQADVDRKAKRQLQRTITKLDGVYWKRISALVIGRVAADGENLAFSDDERLLIDMGLLDIRLVAGADEGLRDRLLAELHTTGAPNHYYLSEWLEDRYRRHVLTERLATDTQADAEGEKDEVLARLHEARGRVYEKLSPYFNGLPGVSKEFAKHMISGQLDDQIQILGISLLDNGPRTGFVRRHNLRQLRQQSLAKLQARLRTEKEQKLLDMLDVIYGKAWAARHQRYEENGGADAVKAEDSGESLQAAAYGEYLDGELKFLKTLLPLGALAGGIARACSVLLTDAPRITKATAHDELRRVRECDRSFTVDPVVVIAPFEGRGIFEFDRDNLVVPLQPVGEPKDAVTNASGNRAMLIDSLQEEGALKAAYEAAFSDERFQEAFLRDYRQWVASVGHGAAEGLAAENFAFFLKHVGPDCSGVIAPSNLRNLGPEAQTNLRTRLDKMVKLNADGADSNLLHRLGVLHWLAGETMPALASIAKAVNQDTSNAMATFSLGMLLRSVKQDEKAAKAFEVCRRRSPDSVWAAYAALAIEGRLA